MYLSTAIKLLDREDILQKIDIDWVGANNGKGQNFNTGDTGLNNTYYVLKANPFLVHKKVMLLYDSDTNKPSSNEGKNFVRKIENNSENQEVTKGIENLLPQEVFTDEYYTTKEIKNPYGRENTITDLKKMKLCRYLCDDKKDPNDFVKFKSVISILDDFINTIVAD